MHPRLRLTLMTIVALFVVIAATVLLSTDTSPAPSTARIPAGGFSGGLRSDTRPIDLTLVDEEGRTVRTAALRGSPVIVTFLYTQCQNECPTLAAQVRIALDRLGTPVPALAISVDPANDSPAARRAFLTRQHLTGRVHFLSGPPSRLQQAWRRFGIQPQEAGREHSAYVVLLGPDGRQRIGFPISQLTPEGVAHDVRALAAGF